MGGTLPPITTDVIMLEDNEIFMTPETEQSLALSVYFKTVTVYCNLF